MVYLKNFSIDMIYPPDAGIKKVVYFLCAEHVEITALDGVLTVMIYPYEWTNMMTPWESGEADAGITGGGKEFISVFIGEIVPYVEGRADVRDAVCAIGGYSLGGLEALFMATILDAFDAVLSVSASLWYEGAVEYFKENTLDVEDVYISLGDRENRTGNTLRRRVSENTGILCEHFGRDKRMVFVSEKGGHFTDISGRIDRAISFFSDLV